MASAFSTFLFLDADTLLSSIDHVKVDEKGLSGKIKKRNREIFRSE